MNLLLWLAALGGSASVHLSPATEAFEYRVIDMRTQAKALDLTPQARQVDMRTQAKQLDLRTIAKEVIN